MDIKWNDMIKKIVRGIQQKTWNKEIFLAILVIGMLEFALFVGLLRGAYSTGTVWIVGLFANLLLAPAVLAGTQIVLEKWFQKHEAEGNRDFEAWEEQWTKILWIVRGVSAAFLVLAFCLFLMRNSGDTPQRVYNYAPNYLLFATIFLQYRLVRYLLDLSLAERTEQYIEEMKENSRMEMEEALNKAVEIERESREKVSRSDKLRMDLITNVSHDLKTPLTSLVGYLELLKKEELGDTARDYLEVITRRTDKMKEMIESLFSLAKVSSGNVELIREKISVNRLIEQIFADMDDRIRQSGLEYIRRFCEEDTQIVTDNRYMYRICQNLMENTLKYSAGGTRVFVKTYVTPEDQIGLEITNTANYLMDFRKEDIVERFVRGDSSRTTEGNGLGLAIVSTYAGALGGAFDLQIDCDQFKAKLLFPRGEEEPASGSGSAE